MPILIERFENHKIHSNLQDITDNINRARNELDLSEEHEEGINRLELLCKKTILALDSIDSLMVCISHLNNLNTYLINANTHLSNFINYAINNDQNNTISQYNSMNSNVEAALQQFALINNIRTPGDVKGLREDIVSLRRSVGQHKRNMEEEYEKFITNLEEENKKAIVVIQEEKNKFKSEIENHFNETLEFKRQIDNELKELKVTIDNEKKRIDNIIGQAQDQISKFQNQFSDAQEKRIDEFGKSKEKFDLESGKIFADMSDKHSTFINDIRDDQKNFRLELEENMKNYNNILEKHKGNVEKIAGVVASTGMSSAYQKVADSENKSKWIWHVITIVSMIGLIWFARDFVSTLNSIDTKISDVWALLFSRILVFTAIGSLSTYAAKQANKHLESERYNRKMELELASIDPYLAVLEKETQDKVKEQLAIKLFGTNNVLSSSINKEKKEEKNDIYTNTSIVRMLEKLVNTIIELKKK